MSRVAQKSAQLFAFRFFASGARGYSRLSDALVPTGLTLGPAGPNALHFGSARPAWPGCMNRARDVFAADPTPRMHVKMTLSALRSFAL